MGDLKGVSIRVAGGWFHEYGWTGPEDFEEAQAAVEALSFTFVYGGADSREEWPGWPAYAEQLRGERDAAESRARLAEENVRIRETSQIPMIPVGAQKKMERLEAAVRAGGEAADALREIAELAEWYASGKGLPHEVGYALRVEVVSIAREALATLEPDEEKT